MPNTLYDNAKEAIMQLFEDITVSKEEAIKNLQRLIDEIELLIDSLKD